MEVVSTTGLGRNSAGPAALLSASPVAFLLLLRQSHSGNGVAAPRRKIVREADGCCSSLDRTVGASVELRRRAVMRTNAHWTGGMFDSAQKRMHEIFSRRERVEEHSRRRSNPGFQTLKRKSVAETLCLVWRRILFGHGVKKQMELEHRHEIEPQLLLQISLIWSLILASPWHALAVPDAVDVVGQPLSWQQNTPHIAQVFDSVTFEGVAKNPQNYFCQFTGIQVSPSVMTLTPFQSGRLQTGIVYSLAEAKTACQESYGFLPCSNSILGNLFLVVVYGYFLLLAAQLISKGSEQLLEVMMPGLVGGLLLPILGALPDALLVFVSGVGGTREEAQEQVMVGIGVLAGSIVMLLTIGWAGSLYAGRCDLSGSGDTAKDGTLTLSLDWTKTGVTTDEQTRLGAWIVLLSALPFVIVQVPLLDGHPSEGPEAALLGCILASFGVVAYCFYQVSYPELQQRRIEGARLQFMRSRALQRVTAFDGNRFGRSSLLQDKIFGPSQEGLKEIFTAFDSNKDGKIEKEELKGLLIGLELEADGSIPDKTQLDLWLQEFDVNLDGTLSEHEFFTGIGKWAKRTSKENWYRRLQKLESSKLETDDPMFWAAQSLEAKKVLDILEAEAAGKENDEVGKDSKSLDIGSIKRKTALNLGGAALAAVFADPLVDSIGGFSKSSGIQPFFVAFVVTPFALNASELFSSLIFARGMTKKKYLSYFLATVRGSDNEQHTVPWALFRSCVCQRSSLGFFQ